LRVWGRTGIRFRQSNTNTWVVDTELQYSYSSSDEAKEVCREVASRYRRLETYGLAEDTWDTYSVSPWTIRVFENPEYGLKDLLGCFITTSMILF
jgi:hypothetical protein